MDLAWIACITLLWGLLILMVWGYQRLEVMSRRNTPPQTKATSPLNEL